MTFFKWLTRIALVWLVLLGFSFFVLIDMLVHAR